MIMTERTLGCDTSHWSGSINFDTMYNAGARFWITKATDAYKDRPIQYEDSKFMEFSKNAFAHGKILTGCYHWLQASIDPKVAADYYLERYNRFFFDFPPILDFEETYVIQTDKFSDFAWRAQVWLEYVKEKTGRTPIIYTAKWYLDYFKPEYISWMSAYPLWVADYTWYSNTILKNPYYMPKYWDKQTMWQFSADGNNRGREFGVDADDICLDWFEGSYDDLKVFIGSENIPEPPTPQPPINEVVLPTLKVISPVRVRELPNTYYSTAVLRMRQIGEVVNVEDIQVNAKDSVWVKDKEGWSAVVHGGWQYMQ